MKTLFFLIFTVITASCGWDKLDDRKGPSTPQDPAALSLSEIKSYPNGLKGALSEDICGAIDEFVSDFFIVYLKDTHHVTSQPDCQIRSEGKSIRRKFFIELKQEEAEKIELWLTINTEYEQASGLLSLPDPKSKVANIIPTFEAWFAENWKDVKSINPSSDGGNQ